jgi:Niemann-Pick C2 protein
MKFICGFVVAALLVALTSASTPVRTCPGAPAPKDVRVKDCNKTPCALYRGYNVSAEWDFVVPEETKALKPRVRATVMGATVNYPFPQKDACATLTNAKCPLDANEDATYELTMPILKNYPKISLVIEFAFLDDNDKVVVCFKLPAKVADK